MGDIMFDWFFFDLDGTLTDPALGITNSIMYALRKLDIEPPERSELYKFIGPPLRDRLRNSMDFRMKRLKLRLLFTVNISAKQGSLKTACSMACRRCWKS